MPIQEDKFPQRTINQNSSLHLWCSQVSDTLNEAGITYNMLLKGLSVNNTMESTKNLIRLISGAKFNKYSTTELTTKELNECVEELMRHLGTKGIYVEFPSSDPKNY